MTAWPTGFDPDFLCLGCRNEATQSCFNRHRVVCRPRDGWGNCSCGTCRALVAYAKPPADDTRSTAQQRTVPTTPETT